MRMLDSDEAAKRLGVKIPTLYSYLSRGLIRAERGSDRRVYFYAEEIEERARRLRRERQRTEIKVSPITTAVSQLSESGPSFRDVPVANLIGRASFEDVVALLWGTERGEWTHGDDMWDLPLLTSLAALDRIRIAVVLAGARDPLRADRRPEALTRCGRRIIATAVQSLPVTAGSAWRGSKGNEGKLPLAERLAARIGAREITDQLCDVVNAIMIMLAEHGVPNSTLTVRLAATNRADVYGAVLGGLGVISGPLHGGVTDATRRLLEDCRRHGVPRALDQALRWQGSVPGFGHSQYPRGDPRFGLLLPLVRAFASEGVQDTLDQLLKCTNDLHLPPPTLHLAIAALCDSAQLDPDAGEVLYTIARMAGWVAHYVEEVEATPRRFRTRTVYVAED